MANLHYRQATPDDIPAMAEIRAGDWGAVEYWRQRIAHYLSGELDPRTALPTRIAFVCADMELTADQEPGASDGDVAEKSGLAKPQHIAGLIAGHLTRRFGCDGELEWISVRPEYRGRNAGYIVRANDFVPRPASSPQPCDRQDPEQRTSVASQLLRRLAGWFVAQGARRICVDVEPSNHTARRFYGRHGAIDLKPHWMIWEDISRLCS